MCCVVVVCVLFIRCGLVWMFRGRARRRRSVRCTFSAADSSFWIVHARCFCLRSAGDAFCSRFWVTFFVFFCFPHRSFCYVFTTFESRLCIFFNLASSGGQCDGYLFCR